MSKVRRVSAAAFVSVSVAFSAAANTTTERNERGELAALCLEAARVAETVYRVPEGLLVAIAIVESALHPFALGTGAASRFPTTLGEARREAEAMRRGARSLSAGCFQLNLRVHGQEAGEWAFDAHASALFAAALLDDARARGGSYTAALALYHGAGPASASGVAYVCRVRSALAEVAPASLSVLPLRCPPRSGLATAAKARALLALAARTRTDVAQAP